MESKNYLFTDIFSDNSISGKTAIVYHDKQYTYNQLSKAVDLCASDLYRMGIKPNDKVALWGYNSFNWMVAFLAITKIEATAVLFNYSCTIEDLSKLMSYTDIKFVVYGNNREVKRLGTEPLHQLSSFINVPYYKFYDLESMDFSKRIEEDENPIVFPKYLRFAKRSSVMIFTTGTTSTPKAVQLSSFSIINDSINSQVNILGMQEDKMAIAIPLFHSFGLIVAITYLLCGSTIYLFDELKPEIIAKAVLDYHITNMAAVNKIYLGLSQTSIFPQIRSIPTMCILGGGFTPAEQIIGLESMFNNARFLIGYGQSETSPIISLMDTNADQTKRATTVGKPIPNCQIKIFDNAGKEKPQGEIGEVVVKGPIVMNGYYNLAFKPIDIFGWLHTGDLGYYDPQGYLHLAGRIKDIIIKSGENISPSEIEEIIGKYPNIKEVKVVGVPHPESGESVEACLTVDDKDSFDIEKLKQYLKDTIAPFKVPSNFFIFNELPKGDTGKIDSKKLKDMIIPKLNYFKEK